MANFKNPAEQSDQILVEQENESRKGNKHPNVFYVDKGGKRWDYSDPEIRHALAENKRRGLEEATIAEDDSGNLIDNRSPERIAQGDEWIKTETDRQTKEYQPQKSKTIHFIYGNGGTGKSRYISDNNLQKGKYLMDSDLFVENYIPDTADQNNPERAYNTFKVHEESSQLRNKMFDPLIKAGYGIVAPKVTPKLSDIKKYKDLGYKVNATFLDADKDTSLSRGLKRYVEGKNRIVPTAAYVDRAVLNQKWKELIDSGLLDDWEHYDVNDPSYKKVLIGRKKI